MYSKSISTVRLLLAQDGIDVNLQDFAGHSAMHLACELKGSMLLAELLLYHPAILPNIQHSSRGPLHLACSHGREEAVQLLLLYSEIDVNLQDKDGETVLTVLLAAAEIFTSWSTCFDTVSIPA